MNGIWLTFLIAAIAAAWVHTAGRAAAEDQNPVVFEEKGTASFYGAELQGKKTASGERFDPNAMTAAHPTLPLGSNVTVTNAATGKQIEVEVNERGPFVEGRDIDLSKGAAKELGMTKTGTATVTIEATKEQVEQAIGAPAETAKVEKQLHEARGAAAADGTPNPSWFRSMRRETPSR